MLKKVILAVVAGMAVVSHAVSQPTRSDSSTVTYHAVEIDGVRIFYREAGSKDRPSILLLHGFPASSRMFDTLIPLLADRYHVVAPDYPGFGHSDAPAADVFHYSFDHIASLVDRFTETVGLHRYSLYLQDYGGPIGFRLAVSHPERVQALIIQNAVAGEEGLGPGWDLRRAFWADRAGYEPKVIPGFLSLAAAEKRHVGSSPHPERYNPDTWTDESALLARPGQRQIQADLFWDYQTNVAAYPQWQGWMRRHEPPTLVLWGRYDTSFALDGAGTYKRNIPNAEVHILDAGHFALDEKVDDIAAFIRSFLARQRLSAS